MNQRVKLQISSDVEDVTRVSSVLLEEALLHLADLSSLINTSKDLLRDINLANSDDLQKLQTALQFLNSTRIPMNKADNRLADVVAIIDGLHRVIFEKPEDKQQQKENQNDNVSTG